MRIRLLVLVIASCLILSTAQPRKSKGHSKREYAGKKDNLNTIHQGCCLSNHIPDYKINEQLKQVSAKGHILVKNIEKILSPVLSKVKKIRDNKMERKKTKETHH